MLKDDDELDKLRKEIVAGRKRMRRVAFHFPYRKKYYILHPWVFLTELWLEFSDFVKRGLYGWCPRDSFALDDYLSSFMDQAVREVKGWGHPTEIFKEIYGENFDPLRATEEDSIKAQERWHTILDKIAMSFELNRRLDDQLKDMELYKKSLIEIDEGLQLFAKHFLSLWS